jgi:hypothetical protein
MKIVHLIIAFLFVLFAYWQLNDPDWPQWVAMYGFVSVTAIYAAFGHPPKWFSWVGIVVAGIWLATLLPDFINWLRMGSPTITGQMQAESPHVELTREFFGLVICLVALGFYAWRKPRFQKD